MKKIIGLLLIFVSVITFSSCGKNVDWSDPNGYMDAKKLESTHVMANNQLVMNINNSNNYLKNITKDMIIVKERNNSDVAKEEKTLTPEELKAGAISDYVLEVNEKEVKITLSKYDEALYMVVFNKAVTNDNKFAYAYFSLLNEVEASFQPYVKVEERKYLADEEDPAFLIGYYNMEVADKSKITFSQAFSDLEVIHIEFISNNIDIVTDGVIKNDEYGIITLNRGFFKGIDYEVDLYFDVDFVGYHIDSSSLKVDNNIFSFDVVFTNKTFDKIDIDNISIEDYTVLSAELVGNEKNRVRLTTEFTGDVIDAIATFSGAKISISNKANEVEGELFFDAFLPAFYSYATLEGKNLLIHYRYYDVLIGKEITEDMLKLDINDLVFEGENPNARLKSFTKRSNGFDLSIELDNEVEKLEGAIEIANAKEVFKTLWGEEFGAPVCAFSAENDNNITLTAEKGEYDESFSETMITAKPNVDTAANVLLFAGYAAQLGAAIYTANPAAAIGSVISVLQLFGLTGKSTEPTIQDVLNKLEDMSNQLKAIDRKIDALKQEVLDSAVATQLGIDKILFNQYRSSWEEFYENYIEKINNSIWDYTTDLRKYFVEFVRNTEDVTLELKYFKNGDNTVFSIENPSDPGYSLEGWPYVSSKKVTIKKSYFDKAIEIARKAQGYSDDFDAAFKTAIDLNIMHDYSDLPTDEMHALYNDTYAQIVGEGQLKVVNEEKTKTMVKQFINFADQLSGKSTGTSKMTYYFKMLESLYNFQSEAKTEMTQYRVNMKRLLDNFAGVATTMAQFCPGIDKSEITNSYLKAYDYIKNNTNLKTVSDGEDYCYTINSKITSKVVRCSFDKGFNNQGKNKCSFWYNYKTYDQVTEKEIDVVNNTKLLTNTNLATINARALNILRNRGESTDGFNFYNYLVDRGLITSSLKSKYSGADVITSYNGINSPSTNDFNVICTSYGVGDYFSYGTTYKYKGSKEGGCWSAKEASGTVYSLASNSQVAGFIDIMARYDESHWYWSTDEHWAFEYFLTGRIALAIVRS